MLPPASFSLFNIIIFYRYTSYYQSDTILDTEIQIRNCTFVGEWNRINTNSRKLLIQDCDFQNVGLYVGNYQSNTNLDTEIQIQNCTFVGGQLYIRNVKRLIIQDCDFQYGNESTVGSISYLQIFYVNNVVIRNTTVSAIEIVFSSVRNGTIIECSIQNNLVGLASFHSHLNIENTNITENGFGLVIMEIDFYGRRIENIKPTASIGNSIFSGNSILGIFLINMPPGIVIDNCSFCDNLGTSITAYQTTFELRGENLFRDNTAERGGGLALYESTVEFGHGSTTAFINNTANEFGGAIYIATYSTLSFLQELLIIIDNEFPDLPFSDPNAFLNQSCFYTTNDESSITFAGNNATLGGLDIYGATVYSEDCDPLNKSTFDFSNMLPSTYKISSDPTRVCVCKDNSPQCENRTYLLLNETRYPGETFTISVALAGYNFGRVAGSVYTNVLGRNYKNVIDPDSQHVQTVDLMECSDLKYTVSSTKTSDSIVLILTAQEHYTLEQDRKNIQADLRNTNCSNRGQFPCTALLTTPLYINVALQDCPLGFDLNEHDGACDCDENVIELTGSNQSCDIQTGYITREGTVWVGVDTSENNTDVYYWHRYCPSDYCMHDMTHIHLTDPDEQCNLNRSGVLCGKCRANYSLSLGGNKCIPDCNNNYIALLIVFAVLGILLVTVIKLLNLTVTSGTINGLIFYANVVWSNKAILFSLQDRENIGYYIITLPIAWINLDFGIETCFSENLNQLTKTGLQFAN